MPLTELHTIEAGARACPTPAVDIVTRNAMPKNARARNGDRELALLETLALQLDYLDHQAATLTTLVVKLRRSSAADKRPAGPRAKRKR
jgi:hypothetical protein